MTNKERFLNHMNFKGVDRCFCMETGFWSELFSEWPMFAAANVKNNAQANAFLGLDMIENFWGELIHANTFLEPFYSSTLLGETETTEIMYNSYGVVIEKMKPLYGERSRMLRPSIVTPGDWHRTKAERFIIADPKRNVDIEQCRKNLSGVVDSPLGLYCGSMVGLIAQMLTFEGMIYSCFDYPEMMEDMVETCFRLIDRFLDQVLPHFKFDIACFYENITCKNGPTLPVWFFREIVVPRYKLICKKLNQYGVNLISVGSDGDIRPLLPYFLECGVNCLSPYEVNGCVHPDELLSRYPGALRIIGGVDKLEIAKGKEEIDKYLQSIYKAVVRGGYIPHIDHDVPPSISEENFVYYLEQKRKLLG
ncbi:MAG: uroporphyrinogen decarboxylase family protein [Clostridiaceae bacterium]